MDEICTEMNQEDGKSGRTDDGNGYDYLYHRRAARCWFRSRRLPCWPVSRESALTWYLDLEAQAAVPHVNGRGWYGVRRLAHDRVADETSDPRVSDGLFGNSADTRERGYLEMPGMGPYAETPNPFGNGVSVSVCAVTGYDHGAYRDRTDDLLVAKHWARQPPTARSANIRGADLLLTALSANPRAGHR